MKDEKKEVIKYKRKKVPEFFLHLVAYGGFNVGDGLISLWNDLHIFLPVEGIYVLQQSLINEYGKDAIDLLYWLGKINGMAGTTSLIKRYGLKENNFVDLLNGASMDGWGKLELDKIIYQNGKPIEAHIICRNSLLGEKYKELGPKNRAVDYFIKGELAGGAQPLFNKKVFSEEKSCIGKGNEYCEFIINFKEREDEPNLIKELNINTSTLLEKLTKITLTRKGRFSVFQKKHISFGNGKLKFYNINGILMLSYVFMLFSYILKKKDEDTFQKIMNEKIESDLNTIKNKIDKSKNYAETLDLLNLFGLGESHIEIMSKDIVLIKNKNNPFSSDYIRVFGRQSNSVDYYLANLIRRAFEKKYNRKLEVEEITCVAKGDRNCTFRLRFI